MNEKSINLADLCEDIVTKSLKLYRRELRRQKDIRKESRESQRARRNILQALKRTPEGLESQVIRDQIVEEVKLKETDYEGMATWRLLNDMETKGLIRKIPGVERQGTNSNLWFAK